jgi:hypothetical protein
MKSEAKEREHFRFVAGAYRGCREFPRGTIASD